MLKRHPISSFAISILALGALIVLFSGPAMAQGFSSLNFETVATGIESATDVTHAGDDRLFLVSRLGVIYIFQNGSVLPQPFLDISDRVLATDDLEPGLLGLAFHPNYAENGFFYVFYTRLSGDNRLERYEVSPNPNLAQVSSGKVVLDIPQPSVRHNGGQLAIGPDGYLYLSTGDGNLGIDPQCLAQDPNSLLGKILRLDIDQNIETPPYYGVPADNPWVGSSDGRDEVWAIGLRNPWRFSFDPTTGEMFIGEVGQAEREEINLQPAGIAALNYGWKRMEGTFCLDNVDGCGVPVPACDDPAFTPPIIEYAHGQGDCSIIGGHVYRGTQLPRLEGVYLYGDYCSGKVWAATRDGGGLWQSEVLRPRRPGIGAFGVGADGELYMTADDTVYRITDRGTLEFSADSFSGLEDSGGVTVTVRRIGGADGTVSVNYATVADTAQQGVDYGNASGTLTWADGDASDRTFVVPLFSDTEVEGTERVGLELSSPSGGSALGARAMAEVLILDSDVSFDPCVADETTLCMMGQRFQATLEWRTSDAQGQAQAVILTPDSGYFWFFNENNPEVFIKMIDGCVDPFDAFWVFAAGLTDVETTLTVVDTEGQQIKVYQKPLTEGFDPIRDVGAFATCP